MVSPEELCRIALVKEWVKNHPNNILSKAFLKEENITEHLPPLGHTICDDRVIPMRPQVALTRKRSPSPPPIGKGKKPHKKAARADSSLVSPPWFPLGQSSKMIKVHRSPPIVSTPLPTPSICPSNTLLRQKGESPIIPKASTAPLSVVPLVIESIMVKVYVVPTPPMGSRRLSWEANMLSMHLYGASWNRLLVDPPL